MHYSIVKNAHHEMKVYVSDNNNPVSSLNNDTNKQVHNQIVQNPLIKLWYL